MSKKSKSKPEKKGFVAAITEKLKPELPKVSTPEEIDAAVNEVAESSNESEFNKNKEALLEALKAEVSKLQKDLKDVENLKSQAESAKNAAVEERKKAEEQVKNLKTEKAILETDKANLTKEKEAIQSEYESAVKTIENADATATKTKSEAEAVAAKIKGDAETAAANTTAAADKKAGDIIDAANKERLKTIADTKLEATKSWEEECERLKVEFEKAAKERTDAAKAIRELGREKDDFDLDREAFEDEKAFVASQKEKFLKCSPAAVETLKLQLSEKEDLYEGLKQHYESLKKTFAENQALMDVLSINLKDASGSDRTVSLKEAAPEINEQLARYRDLKKVYGRYQNVSDIEALEKKAAQMEVLTTQNANLQLERDHFKEQCAAAARTGRELEIMRREVEATDALNKHLVQELESHKMALENRTGDVCPALTRVDEEADAKEFKNEVKKICKIKPLQDLKALVAHVKNYAGCKGGSDKERLYYTDNDIRAFLSGMAVSRLIILQGMSGTGKSSLPRIFAESISGFNKLVPVESSWRDRNELLGYYNDFNKKFNAKGFTIELYRSGKDVCAQIPTFIVLDEMNLARIEYYFSDFLAVLQKPDPNDWIIDLVASDMRTLPMDLSEDVVKNIKKQDPDAYEIWERIQRSRQGDTTAVVSDMDKQKLFAVLEKERSLVGARDLIDGRKVRVPENVWFIGTANKDESTFEISDKVYDRAQVVSLNSRGVEEKEYRITAKSFISVDQLQKLFNAAKADLDKKDSADINDRLKKLEDILIEKFDMAFGNRIYEQAKNFTAVFIAAGGSLVDALDYQISTKIWRKIESCDVEIDAFDSLQEVVKDYKATAKLLNKKLRTL